MPTNYRSVNNLKVSDKLLTFVNEELLKDTDISPKNFWSGFEIAVHDLAPTNKKLLEIRENLQKEIDKWHIQNKSKKFKASKNWKV